MFDQTFNKSAYGAAGGFGASPATEQRSSGRRQGEALLPVTCHMIQSLMNTEDKILLGQKEFSQVVVMGKILEVNKGPSQIDYRIQDDEFEGDVVTVRQFISSENFREFMEDTWVKVFGKIRSFQSERSITAFKILNVETESEWELHQSLCRYAQLFYEKDILGRIHDEMAYGKSRGLAGTSFAPKESFSAMKSGGAGGSDGFVGGAIVDNEPKMFNGAPLKPHLAQQHNVPMQQASGLKGLNAQVCELVRLGSESEKGVNAQDLQGRLPSVRASDIKGAIEYLCSEGHIYSTTDEDHFKLCE